MNLENVRRRAKIATEGLYDGNASIYIYQEKRSPYGEDITEKKILYEDIHCRLSYDSAPAAQNGLPADNVSQGITLFLAREVDIPAGSFIVVTQNGQTVGYQNSGVAKKYPTHQEIKLELAGEHA